MVDYARFTPILIEAVKDRQKIIELQQNEMEQMNKKINFQDTKIESLQTQIDEPKNLIIKK